MLFDSEEPSPKPPESDSILRRLEAAEKRQQYQAAVLQRISAGDEGATLKPQEDNIADRTAVHAVARPPVTRPGLQTLPVLGELEC